VPPAPASPQLSRDRLRDQHLPEEGAKEVGFFDEDQVAERRGVGDDPHDARS
jgi:hypothetical protein